MAVDGITATYIAADQFSVTGNQTADFHAGRRCKAELTGGDVYSTISGSVFAAGTTVTLYDSELDNTLTKVWYGTGIGSFGSLPDHAHDSSEGSGGELTISGTDGDYLARDGSTPLTGDWYFGSQTISGTGDIWCQDLHTAGGSLYVGATHIFEESVDFLTISGAKLRISHSDVSNAGSLYLQDWSNNTEWAIVNRANDSNNLNIYYYDGAIWDEPYFRIEASGGRILIGDSIASFPFGAELNIISETAGTFNMYKYSDDAGGAAFAGFKARGTVDAAAAVQVSDVLTGFNVYAHDGSTLDQVGKFRYMVEAISSGNVKAYIECFVSDASGVLQEMARINSTGLIVGDGVNQQADFAFHVLDNWAIIGLEGDGSTSDAGVRLLRQGVTKWHIYNDATGIETDLFLIHAEGAAWDSLRISNVSYGVGIGFDGTNFPDGTRLTIIADEGVSTFTMKQYYDGSGGAAFSGYKARGGDQSAPTVVVADDVITGYNAFVYDGSTWDEAGKIRHRVESVSSGDVACYIEFLTSDTSGVNREVMRMHSTGDLELYEGGITVAGTSEIIFATPGTIGVLTHTDVITVASGIVTFDGHIRATVSGAYDIGTSDYPFRDIYLTGGSVYLNAEKISSPSSGIIDFNNATIINATISGGGGGGVTDHSALNELDYTSAAHTGFVSIATTQTITGLKTFSQDVTIEADLTAVSGTFDYVEITDSISEIQFTSASGIIGVAGDEDLLLLSAEQLTIQGTNASQIVFSTSSGTIGVSIHEDLLTLTSGIVYIDGNLDVYGHMAIGSSATIDYPGFPTLEYLLNINETFDASITAAYGISLSAVGAADSGAATVRGISSSTIHTGSGQFGTLRSLYGAAYTDNSGGVTGTTIQGVYGNAYIGGDNTTVTNLIGGFFTAGAVFGHTNASGTTVAAGQFKVLQYGTGDFSVENAYGIHVVQPGASYNGTLTNLYGLYIEDMTSSSMSFANEYNIYSAGATSKNYFEGDIYCNDIFTASGTVWIGDEQISSTAPGVLDFGGAEIQNATVSGGGGAVTFLEHSDTPVDYTGQAGKAAVVNQTEDGLEFTTISGGAGVGSLLQDGSTPLTGDWDYGSYTISGTGDIYCNDIFTSSGTVYVGLAQISSPVSGNLQLSGQTYVGGDLILGSPPGPSLISDDFNDDSLAGFWITDVGDNGGPFTEESGVLKIFSGAGELWANQDDPTWAYQNCTAGDFEVKVKVTNLGDISTNYEEAGLVIRLSYNNHIKINRGYNGGLGGQVILCEHTVGSTNYTSVANSDTTMYFRAVRSGTAITCYYSTVGLSGPWDSLVPGGTPLTTAAAVSIGLYAVHSGGGTQFAAHFDDFTVVSAPASATYTVTSDMFVNELQTGGNVYINDSANTDITIGLTINQDTNNDNILDFKSSDVTTGRTETDTFGSFQKVDDSAGGLAIKGYKDSTATNASAARIMGFLAENAQTTKSTSGRGIVDIYAAQLSAGSTANVVSGGNLLTVIGRVGGSWDTKFIVDAEGETWQAGPLGIGSAAGAASGSPLLNVYSASAQARVNLEGTNSGSDCGIGFYKTGEDAFAGIFGDNTGVGAGDLRFLTDDGSTHNEKMRITGDGIIHVGPVVGSGRFNIVNEDSANPLRLFEYYDGTGGASIMAYKARGSQASPAAVQAGDYLGGLLWYGWDGSTWDGTGYIENRIASISSGDIKSYMHFAVSDATGTRHVEFKIHDDLIEYYDNTISGTGDIYCNDIFTSSGTVHIGDEQISSPSPGVLDFGGAEIQNATGLGGEGTGGGNWTLVEETNFTGASDTTISGLNGNVDERYLVISSFQLAASESNRRCKVRPNNDTGANYRSVIQYADTTPTHGAENVSSENGLVIARDAWSDDGYITAETTIFAESGVRRAALSQGVWFGTETSGRLSHQRIHSYWDDTSTNITSLTFDFDGGTATGSIKIYKWSDTVSATESIGTVAFVKNETVVSGTTAVNITVPDTADWLQVHIYLRSARTEVTDPLILRFNGAASAEYHAIDYNVTATDVLGGSGVDGYGKTFIRLGDISGQTAPVSNSFYPMHFNVYNYKDISRNTSVIGENFYVSGETDAQVRRSSFGGEWATTSGVTTLNIASYYGGEFDDGEVVVYGYSNSEFVTASGGGGSSQWSDHENGIYYDSGNVGIGGLPGASDEHHDPGLTLSGTTGYPRIKLKSDTTTNRGALEFWDEGSTSSWHVFARASDNVGYADQFIISYSPNNWTNWHQYMTCLPDNNADNDPGNIAFPGSVSIGVLTEPTQLLHIEGTTPRILVKGGTNESAAINFQNDADLWSVGINTDDGFYIYNNANSLYLARMSPTGMFGINESSNTDITIGLTINQADNDDQIFALKSSDIAHGITGITETDTYLYAKKLNADSGGAVLVGLSEINLGLILGGILTTDDTTKTTGSHGAVILDGAKKSGTGTTSIGTDGNIVAMKNNWSTRWILNAEGETWQYAGADFGGNVMINAEGSGSGILQLKGGTTSKGGIINVFESDDSGGDLTLMADGTAIMKVGKDGTVFINETTNANMTIGLTINQAANDNEAFAIKSSDVSHPVTGLAEADTYFMAKKQSAINGGVSLYGITDDDIQPFILHGVFGTTDPLDARGAVEVRGYKSDGGTGTTTLADAETIFNVRNNTLIAAAFYGDGSAYIAKDLNVIGDISCNDIHTASGTVYIGDEQISSTAPGVLDFGGAAIENATVPGAAAGGGGNWILVDETTVTSGTLDWTPTGTINGDSDEELLVRFQVKAGATAGDNGGFVQFNGDTAANYEQQWHWWGNTHGDSENTSPNGALLWDGNTAGHEGFGNATLFLKSGTNRFTFSRQAREDGNGNNYGLHATTEWNNADDNITSLRFFTEYDVDYLEMKVYRWTAGAADYTKGRQELSIEYATTSGIDILPGRIDIEDGSSQYALQVSGTLFKDSLSLSASTWYYVYAKPPVSGNYLSESEIELSTTEPTKDETRRGHYHESNTDWRCFGAFYSTSVSEVAPFMQVGNRWSLSESDELGDDVSAGTSDTFTSVTMNTPFGDTFVIAQSRIFYSNASAHVKWRNYGSSLGGFRLNYIDSNGGADNYADFLLPMDSLKRGEWRWNVSTTNALYLQSTGYILPDWIAPK